MEKAKAAVSDFLSRSGHHDTTVHEQVAPAVQQETIKPHQHENVTTAVDKEVHQDHYHRTVQPVQDREVLPEKHTTRLGEVEHREFDNRDHSATERNLAQDQAQFKDSRTIEQSTHSKSAAPVVGGEHVHHHIHETIQPVVHKETIQPNVVHTTVPVHEVHHNKAVHHDTNSLPAMTMDEFKSKGGVLDGRADRHDHFEGAPKGLETAATGTTGATGHHAGHHGHHHNTAGTGAVATEGMTGRHNEGVTGSTTTGATGHHAGHHGHHHNTAGTGAVGTEGMTGRHNEGVTGSTTTGGMTSSSSTAATTGGLAREEQHRHADRGETGQGNLTGSSTQGGVTSSNTHQDNNLTSNRENHTSTTGRDAGAGGHAKGVVEGISGDGKNELMHRENESGELPKALTEDKSKFVPHPESREASGETREGTERN